MSYHICKKCGKSFNKKHGLKYHTDNNVCNNKKHECRYCNNRFSTSNAMYKHIKSYCKVKKQEDVTKEDILERLLKLEEDNKKIKKLEEDNKKLKKEIKKLKSRNPTINNGTINTNNGTINTNNNIVLIGYGREDMTKIDKKELLKSMKKGFYSAIQLTDTVHFNPKYPEYHNIYISNIKDKYAMMYDGKNWTLTTKTELIDRLYDDKKYFIEDNLEDFCKSISGSQKRALERWINIDEEHDKIKEVKERIKLLLYNKRDIPLSTNNGELEQLG